MTAWTTTQNKWDITHALQAVGVAAYPTMSSKDLLEDPQLNDRGFFVRLPHAEVGVRTHAGMPWLLAHAPNGVRAPAPLLGQDTESVLRDLLGYSTSRDRSTEIRAGVVLRVASASSNPSSLTDSLRDF